MLRLGRGQGSLRFVWAHPQRLYIDAKGLSKIRHPPADIQPSVCMELCVNMLIAARLDCDTWLYGDTR